jgi:hypothetical protein
MHMMNRHDSYLIMEAQYNSPFFFGKPQLLKTHMRTYAIHTTSIQIKEVQTFHFKLIPRRHTRELYCHWRSK